MRRWFAPVKILMLLGLLLVPSLRPTVEGAPQEDSVPSVPEDTLPKTIEIKATELGFTRIPSAPADNPITAEKIALGRRLFFDPILSHDNTVACASCHRPEAAFASNDKVAIGIAGRKGKRNAPTILNRGYGEIFSWDGRAKSLEDQVSAPLTNENELGNPSVESVVARLKTQPEYVRQFNQVFESGSGDSSASAAVNAENLARAIATFQRVLVYGETGVDRFRASEYSALSREARQGMWIFESRGMCWKCHSGENFSDEQFHNTGVGYGQPDRDVGRFEITQNESDRFKFKTPTLRAVALTAPYMHDGSQATLKDVVEFYNRGGAPEDPALDADMKPLHLSEVEIGYLVEFLKAMSK